RSFPTWRLKPRNSSVTIAQTVWPPTSSGPVAQHPSRKKPVRGSAEHSKSSPPTTFRSRSLAIGRILARMWFDRGVRADRWRGKNRWHLGLVSLAALVAAAVSLPAGAAGDGAHGVTAPCTGDESAAGVPQLPGPRLRMGINPAGRAGALGPPVPLTPIDYSKTLAALRGLRPKEGPFVLRLNRFFWSDGQKGIHHFLKL